MNKIKIPDGKKVLIGGKWYRGELPEKYKDVLPETILVKSTKKPSPADPVKLEN